ncbi:MAG: hypothetical protein GQ474_04755, partial [Sulfurimonas sp.]|nr:hypothetical protein [Sulfurimonas sp.]
SNILFKIGGTTLGNYNLSNIPSDRKVLPTDLLGVDRNESNNTQVINMLQMLQTLDSDGDASNGITILAGTRTALSGSSLDFSDSNTSGADINATLTGIGKTPISRERARAHFEKTLNDTYNYSFDSAAPIFISSSSVSVYENQTNVLTLNILDSTAMTLTMAGADAGEFNLNGNVVTFKVAPDKEVKDSYSFSITARDSIANETTQNITVTILDVDEINPVITSANSVTVDENQLSAIDVDATDANTLSYSISGTDSASFNIDSSTGVVTFKTAPDYETKISYTYTVTVNDGLNSVTQNITINIANLNDNVPVITSALSATVNENQTSAITLQATDEDNNSISYTISGGDFASFNIDNNSGVMTFKTAPDFETKTSYTFDANASDGLNSDIESITINITNILDVVPTLLSFTDSINENVSIGTTVGRVNPSSVGDSDISSFTLSDTTNFLISSGGVITTKTTLDYETTQSYNLTVFATNGAGNSNSQNVVININNILDVVPTISNYSNSIDEDATIGTVVGSVGITVVGDSNITSFTLSDTTNFDISAIGEITTKTVLDFETTEVYNLTAYATNGAGNSSSVNVVVNINNLADVLPTISTFSASIDENTTIGTVVGNMIVSNHGDSNVTSFTLNDTTNFEIDASGEITTKTTFDYENTISYNLTAHATNGAGNSSSVNVIVNINNLIDTVPTLSTLIASIDENLAIGTVVGSVSISDAGDSSITSFTLSDTTNFDISSGGEITTKVSLNFETTQVHNLTAYATNTAGNSANINVTINVGDIYEVVPIEVPTLVVIMNWNDYSEDDPSIWHDKFFNTDVRSVNKWYEDATGGNLVLTPVVETQGTVNDGIITVEMNKNHIGDSNSTLFKSEIRDVIESSTVVDNIDFT